MDDAQQEVARICLAAAADHGFVLAGGNAIRAHGIGTRPSQDIDLFTNNTDPEKFESAVRAVIGALHSEQWLTETVTDSVCFCQLVASKDGERVAIETWASTSVPGRQP